jgi:hypothetical protein
MSFILQELRELVKWESATDEELRTLLCTGTSYPYSHSNESYQDIMKLWVEYLEHYKLYSGGNILRAIQLANMDRHERILAFEQYCKDHKEEIDQIFAKFNR